MFLESALSLLCNRGWHKKGFKLYWKRKSQRVGRLNIDWELIKLIPVEMQLISNVNLEHDRLVHVPQKLYPAIIFGVGVQFCCLIRFKASALQEALIFEILP